MESVRESKAIKKLRLHRRAPVDSRRARSEVLYNCTTCSKEYSTVMR